MKIFNSIKQWQDFRETLPQASLGFIPTMGALHRGHLSLVEASKTTDAYTVVSIFVNPKQFDDKRDFDAYPANLQSDLDRLKKAGVNAVMIPDSVQIYHDDYRYRVTENHLSRRLCGAHRPGHFDGVLTVVLRLLNLVRPDNAYFGEKDYQQLQLIREMTKAFFMPVNIVACATVREPDGLAMSSRNQRLDERERGRAPLFYAALKNSRTAEQARQALTDEGFEVDYVEDIGNRRLAAIHLGRTRLIDNVEI